MSGLAELMHLKGMKVNGSDSKESLATKRLASLGIPVTIGQDADPIVKDDIVVFSSAIRSDHPSMTHARALGCKVIHRSDLLAELMHEKISIAVAGTHGKTTTSAMITHVLTALNLDPSAAIGGDMMPQLSPARAGKGPHFVAEADESDGSFLKYRPRVAVLTNVDTDHMDFFGSRDRLQEIFSEYLHNLDDDGVAVVGWDNPGSREVGSQFEGRRLGFGFLLGCDVRAIDYRLVDGHATFKAIVERDTVAVRLPMFGKHNAQNALCALAVARALELDLKSAAESLATFQGVARRMSLMLNKPQLRLFDDFAHNPGKMAACVLSLREAYPDWTIRIVWQPHRYSRLDTMYQDTIAAFRNADEVVVLPVYAAGEIPTKLYPVKDLALDISAASSTSAVGMEDFSEVTRYIRKSLSSKTVLLTMGAGSISELSHVLVRELG